MCRPYKKGGCKPPQIDFIFLLPSLHCREKVLTEFVANELAFRPTELEVPDAQARVCEHIF